MNNYKMTWPPTQEQFAKIAKTILSNEENYKDKTDIKCLVYWDNPECIIIEPIHFARTEYEEMRFDGENTNRSVTVIIGKED